MARARAEPSCGSVPAPSSSSSTRLSRSACLRMVMMLRHVRREGAQALLDALLVADVGEDVLEDQQPRAVVGRACAGPPAPSASAGRPS